MCQPLVWALRTHEWAVEMRLCPLGASSMVAAGQSRLGRGL